MEQIRDTSEARPIAHFTGPSGATLSARAVHYETIALSRGDAASSLEPLFRDVHVRSDQDVTRIVAGYLGLESAGPGSIDITSHGRIVGSITFAESEIVIDRSASEWPRSGIAVLATRWGALRAASAEHLIVTGDDALIYLVHGPADDKVDARIVDLRARAVVFGHPLPLEPA